MDIAGFIKSIPRLSDNTRRSYQASLELLDRSIKDTEPSKEEIGAWLNTYAKASTLNRHKAAIMKYLAWHGVPWPFGPDVFRGTREEALRLLYPAEIEQIIALCQDPDDKMFTRALYAFGCRVRELLNASPSDIVATGINMTVKGGRQEVKVCPSKFLTEISVYSIGKKPHIFNRTYAYYDQLIKHMGAQIGRPDASLHMIRHGYAVGLIDRGVDPVYVAQLLGDRDMKMIMRYTRLSKEGLQKRLEVLEKT
jgi:site-specific recombinase XerD